MIVRITCPFSGTTQDVGALFGENAIPFHSINWTNPEDCGPGVPCYVHFVRSPDGEAKTLNDIVSELARTSMTQTQKAELLRIMQEKELIQEIETREGVVVVIAMPIVARTVHDQRMQLLERC